jgi:hypothetical protein
VSKVRGEKENDDDEGGQKNFADLRGASSTGRIMKPCDFCLGLDRDSVEDDRWQLGIKADLTAEYSLEFDSSQLSASVKSGCETCSIVSRGLELISRNLSLFDASRAYRGRLILQPDCPLEVEIFDEEDDDFRASTRARIQFYTLPGVYCILRFRVQMSLELYDECLRLIRGQVLVTMVRARAGPSPPLGTSHRNFRWRDAPPLFPTGLQIVVSTMKPALP